MYRQLILASTLLVGIASAQTAPTLPSCANACVTSLLPSSCNLNPDCICHTTNFLDNIGCCVFKACDTADQAGALAYAHFICDPVSASSLLPASATCTSTASSGSATSTGTGSSGAGATASSASSAASSSISSVSASLSSSASSASASLSSAASSVSVSASSAASAASASATSATASPTGAANQLAIGLGAMGAGLLGLAALL